MDSPGIPTDIPTPVPTPFPSVDMATPTPMPLTPWAQMWYNGPPEINITGVNGLNGLATTADVKTMQDAINLKAQRDTSLTVSYGVILADAQEALVGIASDLLGKSDRKSLRDILTHGNRLRGLGFALVILALAGAVIQWMLGGSKGGDE